MSDVQDAPLSGAGDAESVQEHIVGDNVEPADSGISISSQAPTGTGDNDTSSVHSGNEVHAATSDEQEAVEERPEDNASELVHASGVEPAGTEDGSGVPKEDSEDSEESSAVKPQKPAGNADKAVKRTLTAVKSSPVKASKVTTGPASLVKRNVNSATGAGSARPAPPALSKASSTSTAVAKPAASAALRKSTSTANAPASKTTASPTKGPAAKTSTATNRTAMSTRPGNSSSVASSTRTATRRPSVPPKPSLANSTTQRAPSPATVPDARTTTRTVVSPPGSAGGPAPTNRPRASISDGLPAQMRRSSLGPKPTPPANAKAPLGSRRTPGVGSISSLKDIKEDTTVLDHMQKKLQEVETSLKAQSEQTETLRSDLKSAREQLDIALTDARSKQTTIDELQRVKDNAEEQSLAQKAIVDELRADIDGSNADLAEIKVKLDAAEAETAARAEQVQTLEEKLELLTDASESAKREVEALQASSAEAASASAAAAVEHEALLKARDDLEAIKDETAALTAAHESAMQQTNARIDELARAASRAEELSALVAVLKTEKEENATKLSELEVEILELREAAETAEDKEKQALGHIKALEEQIANITAGSEQALIEAKKTDEDHKRALEETKRQYAESLKAAGDEQDKLTVKTKELENELAGAVARYEQALSDASAAEAAHVANLGELEKRSAEKTKDLNAEIQRLANELSGQEAQYTAKIDAVKKEHDELLQEAFQKAKAEASDAHGQDLHTLRMQSQATIEQLNAAHKTFIDELKAEHEAALDAKVKSLDKTISNQAVELKATQDDLAKAKAALSASLQEVDAFKRQIEEAEKAASTVAASSASEHAGEVLRLTRELSSAHDEATALKEVLSAQKDSISEMSNNHSKELEVAAQARAEEVSKLRAQHDEEVFSLLKEKSELNSRVTDLEGELTTLQATVAAQSTASTSGKSNGVVATGSASVSKEDLQKLHEAHNMKLHDLEAQHERTVTSLRSELDETVSRTDELQNEVGRKSMEINYLETEAEEKEDTLTRLKEDILHLTEQLEKYKQDQAPA